MRFILFIALWLMASGGMAAEDKQALPQEVVINGVEFVLIPEGWFWYAVQAKKYAAVTTDEPLHRDVHVWLDSYYIAKYPARAKDLQRYLRSGKATRTANFLKKSATSCSVRRNAAGDFYLVDPERDMPATQLSWELADEFARWMGFRLLTEAEWEKAARGTDKRHWPWGNEYPDDTYAGFNSPAACSPTPVNAFPKGASPYGVYDLAGNTFEIVADWYNEDFDAGLKDGVRNPRPAKSGTILDDVFKPVKILKGGRWASGPGELTVQARNLDIPETSFLCYGTRFAVDVATVRAHLAKGSATIVASRARD